MAHSEEYIEAMADIKPMEDEIDDWLADMEMDAEEDSELLGDSCVLRFKTKAGDDAFVVLR